MSNIKFFQRLQIRSHWDAEQEQWLFSACQKTPISQ